MGLLEKTARTKKPHWLRLILLTYICLVGTELSFAFKQIKMIKPNHVLYPMKNQEDLNIYPHLEAIIRLLKL